jgi:hypothetical protein
MGIIAWIAVGLTAGLLANMPLPGKRSRGPYFHLPDLLHRGAEVTVVELKDIQLPDTMNARRPPLPPTERP